MDTLGPLDAWDIWGMQTPRSRDDLPIPGSPERCIRRRVVEGGDKRLWLVERIGPAQAARREAVAGLLEALGRAGLACLCPYVRSRDNRFVVTDDYGSWQVSPFIRGEEVQRPDYVFAPQAGLELARFLIGLRTAGEAVARDGGLESGLGTFSLAEYVRFILDRMACDPGLGGQVFARAKAAADRIAPFLDIEPAMRRTLAHGDLHPLNCIWQGGGIAAVIDWEFAGPRHELYDLANAVGCMGIEDPACLGRSRPGAPSPTQETAPAALVATLREAGLLDDRTLPLLRPAVAASRFGWLSEWLRRDDRDMAALELDYLDLLTGGP